MKPKLILPIIVVALAAGAAGWFVRDRAIKSAVPTSASDARKIRFYQSPMHPWITSPTPGRCTVCGMELTPVYAGEAGFDATPGTVVLGSNSMNVLHVQTDEVKPQRLRRSLRVAGTIDDDDTRHRWLSAYVEGRIEQLHVNFVGAEVQAGQPLASFYSPMLLAAEREYVNLLKSGASPESSRLVESAKLRLVRMGLSVAQIGALPGKPETNITSELLAPVSGTVVSRDVYGGQYVREGEKLFELADFETMWFQADVYERELVWIRTGQEVEVITPALPGNVFTGRVDFINPNLNDPTRSAKVRVEIANPLVATNGVTRRLLLHRLYAEGRIEADLGEMLAVPRGAVLSPGGDPVVYVDKGGGAYEQRRVKLGRAADDGWEVLDGLGAGERVVTQGNLLIDAQAQLNSAVQAPDPAQAAPGAALSPSQEQGALAFLSFADQLSSALADDDLESFNSLTAQSHPAAAALELSWRDFEGGRGVLELLRQHGHLGPVADLRAARKVFQEFSGVPLGIVRMAPPLSRETAPARVFECPMTRETFDNAPPKARWFQFGTTKRNPYMGRRMLECGVEVKP